MIFVRLKTLFDAIEEHVNLSQFKSKRTDHNSRVGINSVEIRMGPYECGFCNEYETTVIFEAYESLLHDLIWDLVYVGSPTHSTFDQLLMSVNYGTAERGEHKFLMEAPPPDVKKIRVDELIGTTQIILKAKYNGQEFLTLEWPVSVNSPAVNIDELLAPQFKES
ncbi:hypothetical protein PRIPAC_71464 [Pristionchus pacificus]|uniref:Uncharacterized protein n=1 Tax=Pristionchus pacificus TaxID=54126 RepID=A0A2A6CRM6_PRIPA|nr:hypothetical protein PRIPAC_71464 [Pristionchus pacificus]|eukprot:PDM80770.1 hypothetical protein PRIPAC_35773 [Pristionchus pacificus]